MGEDAAGNAVQGRLSLKEAEMSEAKMMTDGNWRYVTDIGRDGAFYMVEGRTKEEAERFGALFEKPEYTGKPENKDV